MGSISSASKIKERTRNFCEGITIWDQFKEDQDIFDKLNSYLKREYDIIPENERVGKGRVYISRYVAKECYNYLKNILKFSKEDLLKFANFSLDYTKTEKSLSIYYFGMLFLSELIKTFPKEILNITDILKEWGTNEDWKIREGAVYPIISSLKIDPDSALSVLSKWIEHDNEYIRRLVAESLRPKAQVKWLRDPDKNDKVLKLLTKMRKDPSLYVRKSVGNNIKDLSKNMPEKMLQLMESWIRESSIQVHDKLATEIGLNQKEKRLIWTIKQGMRWIKEKNPEFHQKLEEIMGKYYILYFDEKRNRLANPPSDN
ncbi:MAG: hypothetical protein EU547_02895 [Promethearchaeota archaeon]|nr:MAG: hypothetical protein EU547_02895 [Candidatus Lokiarchaeota archaeon]